METPDAKSSLLPKFIFIAIGVIILVGLAFYYKSNKSSSPMTPVPQNTNTNSTPMVTPTPTKTGANLANPASVNCTKVGGKLTIQKDGAGNEYGLCEFGDNMACEEWALFRGECPKGGIKTTGFDSKAQMYCAWLGGQTLAVKNATCKLPSGKVCDDEKLFNATCSTSQ